jgi:hypothetical protein
MKIKMKYILFLIFILSMLGKIYSQKINYSSYPIEFSTFNLIPNINISKKKIKVVEDYYCWDSIFRKDTCNKNEVKRFDENGRIIEFISFGELSNYGKIADDTINFTIKLNWISDSVIYGEIHYNIKYQNGDYVYGKRYIHNASTGDYEWDYTTNKAILNPALLYSKDKNDYYNKIRIKLEKNYQLESITYLDSTDKPCEIYYPFISAFSLTTKTEKYDTIFEDKKINKIIYNASIDSGVVDGYTYDAYTLTYYYNFKYDSIGRLSYKETIRNQSGKYLDTIITTFIYYDGNRYKAILGADGTNGYYNGNVYFNYNKKGKLISMSHDKYLDDIVDDEYYYDGNKTIHRYTFYAAGNKEWRQTAQTHYKNGLKQEVRYYKNYVRTRGNNYYVYKKKNK